MTFTVGTRYLLGGLALMAYSVIGGDRSVAQSQVSCADAGRQKLAVNVARQINTLEIASHQKTGIYQTLKELREVGIPEGFVAQLVVDPTGTEYMFFVKDVRDPCRSGVFSDQDQIIFIGQPLR